MTADRDLDRQLAGWLDERATTTLPDGLLARGLARVGATRQRPRWFVADRLPVGSSTLGRAIVPAWAILLLAILAAVAVVATGARLFLLPVPAITVDASPTGPNNTISPPSAPPTPGASPSSSDGPLGGRLILAQTLSHLGDTGRHEVLAIDAGTGERTFLGTLLGSKIKGNPNPRYTFLRSDTHVLIVGGDERDLAEPSDASRAFGFLTVADLHVACCGAESPGRVVLSPRGDRAAFVRGDRYDNPIETVIVDIANGATTRLAAPAGANWFGLLAWAPDESTLVAYGCRPCNAAPSPSEKQTAHHSHLYVIPVNGSAMRELVDVDNGAITAAWTPDGTSLVTQTWLCPAGSYMPRCDPAQGRTLLRTVRVSDGAIVDLSEGDNGLFEYSVSPDGQRLAFRTNDGLFVRSLNGAAEAPIKLADGLAFNASWSPDGAWLLFERNPAETWIVRSIGGEPRLLGTGLQAAAW